MSHHETSRPASGIPLQKHVEELRRRCEAVTGFQGGFAYYTEEFGIFCDYAKEKDLIFHAAPDFLNRPPDEEGNEHQVWFDSTSETYIKVTWPDFFGMLVIHRPDDEPKASPIAYLERWLLHNDLFGDDVSFIGAFETTEGLRLIIRQTAIKGIPATEQQIVRFFAESNWKPFTISGNTAYFDPMRHIVVSDTHRGNLVLMPDGVLAPIDLRVQRLTDSQLDTVLRLT